VPTVIILTPSIRVKPTPQIRFSSAAKSNPLGWFLRAFFSFLRGGFLLPCLFGEDAKGRPPERIRRRAVSLRQPMPP
jgi:hypothetical protein